MNEQQILTQILRSEDAVFILPGHDNVGDLLEVMNALLDNGEPFVIQAMPDTMKFLRRQLLENGAEDLGAKRT